MSAGQTGYICSILRQFDITPANIPEEMKQNSAQRQWQANHEANCLSSVHGPSCVDKPAEIAAWSSIGQELPGQRKIHPSKSSPRPKARCGQRHESKIGHDLDGASQSNQGEFTATAKAQRAREGYALFKQVTGAIKK